MEFNKPGKKILGRLKPFKQAQHAKLYSDLLQATTTKEETFDSPGLLPGGGGLNFCIRSTPLEEDRDE